MVSSLPMFLVAMMLVLDRCKVQKRILTSSKVYNGNLDAAMISGAQWPVNEPIGVVSAMAAVTKSIGFGVTVSTTYEQPYHLARRLSTVDHLSKGRLGWNVGFVAPSIECETKMFADRY